MNQNDFNPLRYSILEEKNPREIVMLRGSGCKWRKCRFCDYHLDFSSNCEENYQLNKSVLSQVTGKFHRLEVINSGSFLDLDEKTILLIKQLCLTHQIKDLHFECHWIHREEIQKIRAFFVSHGIQVHIKSGVETFDASMRELVLCKGFDFAAPEDIAHYFDEVCLLQGISNQTVSSMIEDIEIGLNLFQRVCVNIMIENQMPIKPDADVIRAFKEFVYPLYIANPRVDILLDNTDFGVGSELC